MLFPCLIISEAISTKAFIFATSARWVNYRHSANAFALAHLLKRNNFNSSDIFLGVGEDPVHNSRNPFPGQIFLTPPYVDNIHEFSNLTDDDISVNSIRATLLRGSIRGKTIYPGSLEGNRVLLYFTGHGGDEFLKFRETDELRASELAVLISEFKRIHNFKELLIIMETCQADSMFHYINTSGVTTIASSKKGESAISSEYDSFFGIPLSDRFTAVLYEQIQKLGPKKSLYDLFSILKAKIHEHTPVFRQFNAERSLSQMKIGDYFFSN